VSRLLAGVLCVAAMPAAADAAIKVREGDVNHWIEHYQRERQPRQPAQRAAANPAIESDMRKSARVHMIRAVERRDRCSEKWTA
jgi:hypothetical protein